MSVSIGDMASTSFSFESGAGSFLVCTQDTTLEVVKEVVRISVTVLSRQGRLQSTGRVEYEKGLLRLREPSRYTPPNALDLPMLLLSHEEFKIKLHDSTTRVHQQSLSSYDSQVTLAVSVYDMSVVPSDALKIGPTGRIVVSGAPQSPDTDGDELPPPPPPEEDENDDEVEEQEQWMPVEGGRYRHAEENDDGEYVEIMNPREEKELQELAALFNVTLKTAQRHQKAAVEVDDYESRRGAAENSSKGRKDKEERGEAEKKNLRVSLSLDDVLEQMRLHQEQEKELRAKAEAEAAAAAARDVPGPVPVPAYAKEAEGVVHPKDKSKARKERPKRAPLSAPLSKYVSADTGEVVKRPFLKKGSAEMRRKALQARAAMAKEQGRAPLARRGAPMKRVVGGSHSDRHKLTIGSKTSRAVIRERNRVSSVRLAQQGETAALPAAKKPPVPPYREKKDRHQQAREDRMRKYVEMANANATASAASWKYKDAGKVNFDARQQLVATRHSVTDAREQNEPVTAGAGVQKFRGGDPDQQAWRPPVTNPNPDPIIFSRPLQTP